MAETIDDELKQQKMSILTKMSSSMGWKTTKNVNFNKNVI